MKTIAATITTTHDISIQRVSDLLCSALEGGSSYWYTIVKFITPKKIDFESFVDDSVLCGPEVYKHLHYPLSEGGALLIMDKGDDDSGTKYRLDLDSIRKGMQIFAEKYPRHFQNFISENDDADTGDAFLQCCLFGDIIFG